MSTVATCTRQGCTGHLGKFDSCRDEALYVLSLDQASNDGWTGSVEWNVHCTLILLADDTDVQVGDTDTVRVPAGSYLVLENDQGFVSVVEYDTVDAAVTRFDEIDAAYCAWAES